MTTRLTVKTVQEYARALIPHLEHEVYRCDKPHAQLMGKGCRTCGVEAFVALADFRETGDIAAFQQEMEPFVKKGKKK